VTHTHGLRDRPAAYEQRIVHLFADALLARHTSA
jgi:hypothetical protein